jgi:hypothetical protein
MKMLNHKVGDMIRIQSQKWIDAQDKGCVGGYPVISKCGCAPFIKDMFRYAGKTAKIVKADEKTESYELDIDKGEWDWQDWMFDPDYKPKDEPLSAEDAIRAMMDGETLYRNHDMKYYWSEQDKCFYHYGPNSTVADEVRWFNGLYRRPAKRKRRMTQREAINWAHSKESWGWLVRCEDFVRKEWMYPVEFDYSLSALNNYQRARLLPDLSGIDESTIQGFEVEDNG